MNKIIGHLTAPVAVLLLSVPMLLLFGRENAPRTALIGCIMLLLLSVAVMAVFLRVSLRKTLYSYRNIGLIGGILFASVLIISLCVLLFSNPGELTVKTIFQRVVKFPRRFSFYALFVIVAVSLLVGISNIVLIRKEGFCLNNALSLVVAVFYIGGTVVVYLVSDFLTEKVYLPQGFFSQPLFIALHTAIPLFLLLMLCYLECILAGTAIMGWKAARQKPSFDKDYIIILGCSIDKRGGLLPLLKGRVNRAIRFAWEQEIATGKPLKYVPSGGQGANEIMSEGSAMELYLKTRGAEVDEVFPEKKSTDTMENFCFSKKVIEDLKPDAKVAFATTNYHMLRSGIIARRAGLDAEGIAGDTKWYFWPNGFVREFFGILALNVRTHILTAAAIALICAAIGCIGYFANLI